MTTMGLATIMLAFQEASMMYTLTNGYFGSKNMKIASQAIAFIQGTGLEITLKVYGLDYDANQLRSTFYYTFHDKHYEAY